jgi:hypothetical protein
MFLCIEGFFPDGHEDEFLQFELDVPVEFNDAVLDLVGWKSLDDGAQYGSMDLTSTQVVRLEEILGETIPHDLDISISVLA